VRALLKDDWVVYAKPAFGDPTRVLRYLGRYTHRVAISSQRLLSFDGQRVSFRWKDFGHGNKQRIMTLSASKFLRRFCQHVLPRGFVRIRHFGYLANYAGLLSSRSLVSSFLASLHEVHISPAPRQLLGVVRAADPTCSSGPTSPRNNWRFDAN
jgi:hypothetical protein